MLANRLRRVIYVKDPKDGRYIQTVLPPGELKREFPGFCELCGRDLSGRHKGYHHWDDSMPAMGIWVCNKCHDIAEGVEKGIVDIYLKKKGTVEKAYALEQIQKLIKSGIINEIDISGGLK